ncbi:MAG: hemerythrin domain-containing protein [Candidatus Methanospirareceae archaeon]
MVEHRLIEKMLFLTSKELQLIKINRAVNPNFIDTFVDFIRIYADRTHHGKEEDILFKALEHKNMFINDRKMMHDLANDHIMSRKAVGELAAANKIYATGDRTSMNVISDKLTFLLDLYPNHISKEDKLFFQNTEKYFSAEELDNMLNDFREFDRKMIHEKYRRLYESLKAIYE